MLDHVLIENFRCLRSVDVPLRPITVLVGPNDSGKSAFLAALRFLTGGLGLTELDSWRGTRTETVLVKGTSGPRSAARRGGGGTDGELAGMVWNHGRFFQLPTGGVAMRSGGVSDTVGPPEIAESGANLPAFLDHFLRRDRKRLDRIVAAVSGYVAGLANIGIRTPDPGSRQIEIEIEDQFVIPGESASVGVRLLIFFVALAYHPTPPRLLLIEEPENGVHPKRLKDIMGLLRDISQAKHGEHAAQVVLTTHSPYLLDQVDLKTDQVLVFKRNDDGSRTAEPADEDRLKTFLDEFMLGEVWYNEGEAGLVKRPS